MKLNSLALRSIAFLALLLSASPALADLTYSISVEFSTSNSNTANVTVGQLFFARIYLNEFGVDQTHPTVLGFHDPQNPLAGGLIQGSFRAELNNGSVDFQQANAFGNSDFDNGTPGYYLRDNNNNFVLDGNGNRIIVPNAPAAISFTNGPSAVHLAQFDLSPISDNPDIPLNPNDFGQPTPVGTQVSASSYRILLGTIGLQAQSEGTTIFTTSDLNEPIAQAYFQDDLVLSDLSGNGNPIVLDGIVAFGGGQITIQSAPEPTTMGALGAFGAIGAAVGYFRRRKQKQAESKTAK